MIDNQNDRQDDEINELSRERADQLMKQYRKILFHMGTDLPISALCLPKRYENVLTRAGISRVYDFVNSDLKTIPGLGERAIDVISFKLHELFSIDL